MADPAKTTTAAAAPAAGGVDGDGAAVQEADANDSGTVQYADAVAAAAATAAAAAAAEEPAHPFLNRRLRIEVQDGRVFNGQLAAADRAANLVLVEVTETPPTQEQQRQQRADCGDEADQGEEKLPPTREPAFRPAVMIARAQVRSIRAEPVA